jgi:hypothetical protein
VSVVPAVLLAARPARAEAVLDTLAHSLDTATLTPPSISVVLQGGWSRRLREALAPWGPGVDLVENADASSPRAIPAGGALLLKPGVMPAMADIRAWLASHTPTRPLALPAQPWPSESRSSRAGLFGRTVEAYPKMPTTAEPDAPLGAALLPSDTAPETVAALMRGDPSAWTGLKRGPHGLVFGTPAPPGPWGSPEGAAALAGRHRSQPALILGNGRSRPDLAAMKARHADLVVVGFNGGWRLRRPGEPAPDWLMIEDRLVAEDEAETLNATPGPPALIVPDDHADILPPAPGRLHVAVDWSYYRADRPPRVPGFATRAGERLCAGQSVAYLALQVAFLMDCDPVLMAGMDLDYRLPPPADARLDGRVVTASGPDPNHFDAAYFGPGRRWHLPKTDRMLAAFRHAAAVYASHGRRLVNLTPGGRLSGVVRATPPHGD